MRFIIIFLLFSSSVFGQKTYQKIYFDDGSLKSEGWLKNNQKTAYWKFYYENGKLEKEGRFLNNKETKYWYFYRKDGTKEREGHFIKGAKSKWWLFYNEMEIVYHKCQLKNDKKNGYSLQYEKNKLVKAEKYKAGKKVKEWTDYSSFRKEDKLSDLQWH